jgi:amidophosphoribosyltransferase
MCGIFGVFSPDGDIRLSYSRNQIRHRGSSLEGIQEGYFDKDSFIANKGHSGELIVQNHTIVSYIGQTRYATSTKEEVSYPLLVTLPDKGDVLIAINGHISNYDRLQQRILPKNRYLLWPYGLDTSIIPALLLQSSGKSLVDKFTDVCRNLEGAYSIVAITGAEIVVCRDPYGRRPLMHTATSSSVHATSETEDFDTATSEVPPNAVIGYRNSGYRTIEKYQEEAIEDTTPVKKFCALEVVYLHKNYSILHNRSIYARVTRLRIGTELYNEFPFEGYDVAYVPNGGSAYHASYCSSIGMSTQTRLNFTKIITLNSHQRTFLQKDQAAREEMAEHKFVCVNTTGNDSIVVIDDSIIRGTVSKVIVRKLRAVGYKKIVFLSASPRVINTCSYGVDLSTKEELVAVGRTDAEIAEYIGADFVGFLSKEAFIKATKSSAFCFECWEKKPQKKNPKQLKIVY